MVDTFTNKSLGNNSDGSEGSNPEHRSDARNALRKNLRDARRALSQQALDEAADALLPNVLGALHQLEVNQPLSRVAGYLAFQGEIDVAPVMRALRDRNITTYVPMLDGEVLQFAPWSDQTPYTTNRFGIIEPTVPKEQWLSAQQLDAVLVPLVAFDNEGHRMGMGGGFYDKTFAHKRDQLSPPWLLGVAHELQRVESVFPEWWDVKLDNIITDKC